MKRRTRVGWLFWGFGLELCKRNDGWCDRADTLVAKDFGEAVVRGEMGRAPTFALLKRLICWGRSQSHFPLMNLVGNFCRKFPRLTQDTSSEIASTIIPKLRHSFASQGAARFRRGIAIFAGSGLRKFQEDGFCPLGLYFSRWRGHSLRQRIR